MVYKERYVKKRLLRRGWIGQVLHLDTEFLSHRDKMDSEWEQFLRAAAVLFGVCPAIYAVCERLTKNRVVLYLVSIAVLGYLLTFKGMLIISVITSLFYGLGCVGSRSLIWLFGIGLTTLCNWYNHVFTYFLDNDLERHFVYLVEFCIVTQIFRVMSMSLTIASQKDKDPLFMAFEYNFFLPIFCGPWYIYSLYREERLHRQLNVPLLDFTRELFKIFSMFLFIEFYLHWFPFSSVQFDNQTRSKISLTSLAGIVLAAVQHFSNKYTVLYGLPSNWARLVGFSVPGGPHNVSTRCTFRDMWKEFDKGLHLFLKHHVYLPIIEMRRNIFTIILATVASFATVYYWHGATGTCLHWASFNCAGVLAEVLVFKVSRLELPVVSRLFPGWLQHRFHICIQSVLFGFLINSNLIFLFQSEAASQIHNRLYFEDFYFTLHAHVVLYTGVIAISGTFTPEKISQTLSKKNE